MNVTFQRLHKVKYGIIDSQRYTTYDRWHWSKLVTCFVQATSWNCIEPSSSRHVFGDGKTGRAAVHQWDCSKGQRCCAGLLSYIGVGSIRGYSRHPWANRTLWLHFLFPRLLPPLPSPYPQGWTSVEQVFQISPPPVHRGARWGPFYLRPILDFPLRNGARVLKRSACICDPS